MKLEADQLRNIAVSGIATKVVAIGIGSGVSQDELDGIASDPDDRNVIHVQDFTQLSNVEDQLRNASCTGL